MDAFGTIIPKVPKAVKDKAGFIIHRAPAKSYSTTKIILPVQPVALVMGVFGATIPKVQKAAKDKAGSTIHPVPVKFSFHKTVALSQTRATHL
jgi:hypothetical protein